MKIVCVSHNASLTGAPKVIFQLARKLAHNHEIILVTKESGPLWDEILDEKPHGMSFHNANTAYGICNLSFEEKVETARLFLNRVKPDLVYANSAESAEWAIAAKMLKIRNIFHLHEMKIGLNSALKTKCLSLDIMDYVDQLICVSRDVEHDVFAVLPVKPKNSIVLENFFECDRLRELSQIEMPLPNNALGEVIKRDRPIICGCGTASYRKGVDIFFDTARQLPEFQFLWIGKWNTDSSNPAHQTFETEALSNFFITGEVNNPYFYLGLSNILALTSREDPYPLVVFESLILGKQVICFSETGGSRFILDKWGYVVFGKPNAETLSRLLKKLFAQDFQDSSLKWMSQTQEEVCRQYNIESAFSKVESIIIGSSQSNLEELDIDPDEEIERSIHPRQGVFIKAANRILPKDDRLAAFNLQTPSLGHFFLDYTLPISGWVISNALIKAVEVSINNQTIKAIPLARSKTKLGRYYHDQINTQNKLELSFSQYVCVGEFIGTRNIDLWFVFENGDRIPFFSIFLESRNADETLKGVPGPDFVIGGAVRGATVSIYNYLSQHPSIIRRHPSKIDFFNDHQSHDLDWYLSLFAIFENGELVQNKLIGETSPSYLASRKAPVRLKALFPNTKIIFSLRDPVARAVSQYYYYRRRKLGEHRTLDEAFSEAEIEKSIELVQQFEFSKLPFLDQGHADTSWYLYNGQYATHLRNWFRAFPKEQILILDYQDFVGQKNTVQQEVLSFLGLSYHEDMSIQARSRVEYPKISDSLYARLYQYYEAHNYELQKLLGSEFSWMKTSQS
ncbi:MAG: sulfotransferase domain-containing protein [Elainella sp. Prado103]|nr:sulfotransferase domain-containing protein [Elainella sp. Prado103]